MTSDWNSARLTDFGTDYQSYSNDEKNVTGALLFLAYIVAALVFSCRTSTTIWRLYCKSRTSSSPFSSTSRIVAAVLLCLASFSVLSYNMLSFLVLSYTHWCDRHGRRPEDVLRHATQLWDWMSHSTLFEDFARALVNTPARSFWTQIGLLQTYALLTEMQQGSLPELPCKLDLICLSQILPISFTYNLYNVLRLLQGASSQRPNRPKTPQHQQEHHDQSRLPAWLTYAAYAAAVSAITFLSNSSRLIRAVLLLRFLLLVPLSYKNEGKSSLWYIYAFAIPAIAPTIQSILKEPGSLKTQVEDAFFGHPAVCALAHDAVIAVVSRIVVR